MKRCSTSPIIRQMQIKTITRYLLALVRMIIIKKSTNHKSWRGCGEKGTILYCWWECKLIQPLWNTVWRFLKKLGIKLPCMRVCSVVSILSDSATPWTVASQDPLSMGFSRQEYWSGFPCPRDLLDPGIKPVSPVSLSLQVDSLLLSHQGSSKRPCNPTIPLLGIYPEKTIIEKDIMYSSVIKPLFPIAGTWKQPG